MQQVDPRLVTVDSLGQPDTVRYEHLTAVLTKAVQELSLRLEAVASTTATSTPDSQSFAEEFFSNIFTRLTNWFAEATNGIKDLFANTFQAKEKICVDDQCLTKEDIRSLLEISRRGGLIYPAPAPVSEPEPIPVPEPDPEPEPEPEATSTPEIQPETDPPLAETPEPEPQPEVPPDGGQAEPPLAEEPIPEPEPEPVIDIEPTPEPVPTLDQP